ncbi:uncharacterized protein LOC114310214 [Camellia sinensis]|uniref:uncharacterized protein LOC114310214 n=1 Tax=Camellia sinensis TaxID=4442 RepID=UPI00103606B2|nr:uncharacterized protein LOC114310214 [Camellia sinensis]
MATTVHNDLSIDDDDVVEVGRRNSGPWPQAIEALFITLMDEEVKTKSSKITGTFTKQAWNRLRDQMNAKTQYQYNAHQLRNKYNQLHIMFNQFTGLLKHTGVGWDSQRFTITAPDDVWEALYKVNSHVKRFRKKMMVYYHEWSHILGDTSVTGKLAHPFTKSPSESSASSDHEFKVKNEDLNALQIDSDNDNEDGQGKNKGKSKMIVTNVGDDSGSIEGGSTASHLLLKESMALLHGMEEIPAPAFTKAVNKLASDPIIRESFQVFFINSPTKLLHCQQLEKNERNRVVQERFQHFGQTISKYFNRVLKAVCRLGKQVIRPLDFDEVLAEIRHNPRFYPFFKDCVGAIDGTHISARVPASEQIPYRGKHTVTTQNVMCLCSFDVRFTYVLASWKGTADDSKVFIENVHDPANLFLMPSTDKYYVVDSGYTNVLGFLSPYHGERYHLNEFRTQRRQPRNKKKMFNYRHSSLRNVIK